MHVEFSIAAADRFAFIRAHQTVFIILSGDQGCIRDLAGIGNIAVITGDIKQKRQIDQESQRESGGDLQGPVEEGAEIKLVNDLHDTGGDHGEKDQPDHGDDVAAQDADRGKNESGCQSDHHSHGDADDGPNRPEDHSRAGAFVPAEPVTDPGQQEKEGGQGQKLSRCLHKPVAAQIMIDRGKDIPARKIGELAVPGRQGRHCNSPQKEPEEGLVEQQDPEGQAGNDCVATVSMALQDTQGIDRDKEGDGVGRPAAGPLQRVWAEGAHGAGNRQDRSPGKLSHRKKQSTENCSCRYPGSEPRGPGGDFFTEINLLPVVHPRKPLDGQDRRERNGEHEP